MLPQHSKAHTKLFKCEEEKKIEKKKGAKLNLNK
jgi:hypothetical protein